MTANQIRARTLTPRLEAARAAWRERHIGGAISRTAGFNVASAAAASLGGVILARTLGAAIRGEYAAVTSWFGVVLMLGEAGQSAAVCFFVASDPRHARGYVATSRAMMVITGGAAMAAGFAATPALAHGNPGLAGAYRVVFAGSAIAFIGNSYVSALQARSIDRWNWVRLSQPVLAVTGILLLWSLGLLSLYTAAGTLIVTMAIQLGYSYYCCWRAGLAPGCAQLKRVRPLAVYGLSQIAAIAPASVNKYLDQLILSQVVPSAALGHYAVAVSITLVPIPMVSAIGSVAFPRLAARRAVTKRSLRLQRVALLASAGAAIAILAPAAVAAYWLVPLVFGPAYRAAVPLLWVLTPGGVFLACGQVAGDLLRGLGRPACVAAAQGLAAVFTVALLLALLPSTGVTAAAIASSVAYGIALAMMIRCLHRLDPASAEARPASGGDGAGGYRGAIRRHPSQAAHSKHAGGGIHAHRRNRA